MSFTQHFFHPNLHLDNHQALSADHVHYIQETISCCPYGSNCPLINASQLAFIPLQLPPNLPIISNIYIMEPIIQNVNARFRAIKSRPGSNDTMEFRPGKVSVDFVYHLRKEILRNSPTNLRVWEHVVNYGRPADPKKTKFQFNVITYNILSQVLLETNTFINSRKKEYLTWETRWKKIFDEVMIVDPDVICLQEVENTHLPFYKRFEDVGYRGIFKKKTRDKSDGCAIFYKESMFLEFERITVEFYCPNVSILTADSIAIILKLAPRVAPHKQLVVANTHLVYTTNIICKRLAQMRVLLKAIEKLTINKTENEDVSIILTGDFNSNTNSTVIRFIKEGRVCIPIEQSLEEIGLKEESLDFGERVHDTNTDDQKVEIKTDQSIDVKTVDQADETKADQQSEKTKIDEQLEKTKAEKQSEETKTDEQSEETKIDSQSELQVCKRGEINNNRLDTIEKYRLATHPFKFKSAYDSRVHYETGRSKRWITVDYIFFTDKSLKVLRRLGPPNLSRLQIPNKIFASDHISIAAVFEMEVD